MKPFFLLGFLCFLVASCENEKAISGEEEDPVVQIRIDHFPVMELEEGKELTSKRIALGRKLFFDPILSRDQTISCATCHLPHLAFSDGQTVAIGIEGRKHFRNSPSLFNVAWQPYLFMDGGNPSLESQVIGPIEEHREMDNPFPEAMARVAAKQEYQNLFQAAFKDDVNPYTLSLALATYERSLVSFNSPFDRFEYARDSTALNVQQQRGLDLFKSARLNCNACHQLPLTTDFSFKNNGLKLNYADEGRARVTNNIAEDEGLFKVATLRNINLTAPYMHDGSLSSLEEVIDHYASGGSGHRLQSPLVKGFSISPNQKADLIAFLKALTDTSSYRDYQF